MDSAADLRFAPAEAEIVDLTELAPNQLEPLWRRETELWSKLLYWNVSPVVAALRQALRRKQVRGKAARLGSRSLAYCYYLLEQGRAVLGSLVTAGDSNASALGSKTLDCVVRSLQSDLQIRRIESAFVTFDEPWVTRVFAVLGFDVYERRFLRRPLTALRAAPALRLPLQFELWTPGLMEEAAPLMQSAHSGRGDAQMNALYRTCEGCRALLENILYQGGCGAPLHEASIVARDESGRLRGLAISTEISPGHAHLAQVAVSPAIEGKGLGTALLARTLWDLRRGGYRTVSLMVSGSNHRANALYASAGFREVLRFPVFSWDRDEQAPRSR